MYFCIARSVWLLVLSGTVWDKPLVCSKLWFCCIFHLLLVLLGLLGVIYRLLAYSCPSQLVMNR